MSCLDQNVNYFNVGHKYREKKEKKIREMEINKHLFT